MLIRGQKGGNFQGALKWYTILTEKFDLLYQLVTSDVREPKTMIKSLNILKPGLYSYNPAVQ
jgi:hypothetical protein